MNTHTENPLLTEEDNNEIDNFDFSSIRIKNPTHLFFLHCWTMIKKRIIYFKRDVRSLLCEIVFPCLVVVFGLSLTLVTFFKESPSVYFKPTDF